MVLLGTLFQPNDVIKLNIKEKENERITTEQQVCSEKETPLLPLPAWLSLQQRLLT